MCGPLAAAFPALAGGLSGASGLGTALGIASAAASFVGQNSAINAQQKQLAEQATQTYAENAAKRRQADRNAAQEGYQAARERDKAVGRAIVRNSSLGISGTAAGELVADQSMAGNYNVANAVEQSRDNRTATLMNNNNTYASVTQRSASLDSQRPGIATTLLGMATGGLDGYLLGNRVDVARGAKR